MKANELRIGNLAACFNPNKQGMPHDLIVTISWKHLRNMTEEIDPNYPSYSGLELTEDLLNKFGAYSINAIDGYCVRLDRFLIDKMYKTWKVSIDTTTLCYIKYVHQLQNLYFALTGQELEFAKVGE
jgi:hypothetical protein